MRIAFAVLLIAIVLLPVAAGNGVSQIHPAGQNLSLAEYWNWVENTRQIVTSLQTAPDATTRHKLDQLADEWETITRVQLPDGRLLPVDHSEMAALFRQDPPLLATILVRLDTLLTVGKHLPDGKFSNKDVDKLTRILAEARFTWAEAQPSLLAQWWGKVQKAVQAWLDRLFGNLHISLNIQLPTIRTVLIWVLVILLLGILAYAGRGLFGSLVAEAELGADGLNGEEPLSSDSALQRADTLSVDGNYRAAVRYLYLSALLLLDERGLLRYDRSSTNREYLRTLAGKPNLAQPMRVVIDIFDRVWYGFEEIDQATYQAYLAKVGELRKQKP
jgi:hypothetical protein